jgi:hypothetical protein
MRRAGHDDEKTAILAVLAAAAREAEELLALDDGELPAESAKEADRRLKLFMRAARQTAR